MRSGVSHLYLAAGGLAVGCYLVVPPFVGQTWLFELVGLSAAAAIALGIARYSPRPRLPWVLFVVAQVMFVTGDFFYYSLDLAFPSFGDAFYIAFYPLQAAGLLVLIRSRTPGRDWASLLDALIVSIGFGLFSWIYLIEPYTRQANDSQISRLVSMAYPAMDVLLLAVTARLVIGGGARSRAFYLMTASVVCLVVTDVVYGAIELNGSYSVGSSLDVGWMTTYLLWGAAALDPSMRRLSERAATPGAPLGEKRLVVLAAASVAGPAMIILNSQWPIDGFDTRVAATVSVVVFLLVLVRMLGLVSDLRDAGRRHESAERREAALRRAATCLTAATDRDEIRRAATSAARDLSQGLSGVEVEVEIGDNFPLSAHVTPPADAVVVALSTQARVYGRLILTSTDPVPVDVVDGLETLGAQVALALEAAALTADLRNRHSDARVGALVQNSSDVIMVLDAELVIRYVTPSIAQVLGHRPEALLGTALPTLVDPSETEQVIHFYAGLAHTPGATARSEWRIRRGDGHFTDVEAVSTDLLDNPTVHGIVVTARDITERKALEVGLQRQVQELEDIERIRSEFVATVSHELRTPLTSIVGEIEMLADGELGDLSDRQAHGVEVIGRNSGRLLSMIDDLLLTSHLETRPLHLHCEPVPVTGIVEAVRTQVVAAAEAKSVTLTLSCDPGTGIVVVDREQLDRALSSLLTNAIKFTPAGGFVAMEAQREVSDVVFTVSDTGVGIPEDEQIRLFTRFFRSSVANRMAVQGSGLGLVIVKRIVEEHGGTISIVSVPDEGTTVTVKIPAGEASDRESAAA